MARMPFLLAIGLSLLAMSSASMVGGESKANPKDPANVKAAEFAVSTLNHGHNGRNNLGDAKGTLTLVHVKEVSTQVVAGIAYHLVLAVRDEAGSTYDVATTVWSRPWLEARNDESEPAWQLTKVQLLDKDKKDEN